jgi:hypothetical protein
MQQVQAYGATALQLLHHQWMTDSCYVTVNYECYNKTSLTCDVSQLAGGLEDGGVLKHKQRLAAGA